MRSQGEQGGNRQCPFASLALLQGRPGSRTVKSLQHVQGCLLATGWAPVGQRSAPVCPSQEPPGCPHAASLFNACTAKVEGRRHFACWQVGCMSVHHPVVASLPLLDGTYQDGNLPPACYRVKVYRQQCRQLTSTDNKRRSCRHLNRQNVCICPVLVVSHFGAMLHGHCCFKALNENPLTKGI